MKNMEKAIYRDVGYEHEAWGLDGFWVWGLGLGCAVEWLDSLDIMPATALWQYWHCCRALILHERNFERKIQNCPAALIESGHARAECP